MITRRLTPVPKIPKIPKFSKIMNTCNTMSLFKSSNQAFWSYGMISGHRRTRVLPPSPTNSHQHNMFALKKSKQSRKSQKSTLKFVDWPSGWNQKWNWVVGLLVHVLRAHSLSRPLWSQQSWNYESCSDKISFAFWNFWNVWSRHSTLELVISSWN